MSFRGSESSARIWRRPAEESVDLYPGLTVWDARVTGSITVGQSRLPLWSFVHTAVLHDWDRVEDGWSPTEQYGFTAEHLAEFLYDVCELRGEFARLVLVLADAERRDRRRGDMRGWWDVKRSRRAVLAQLRRCVAALEQIDGSS